MSDLAPLFAQVREARAKGMEALAADVHPYSAQAVRDWEEQHEAALSAIDRHVQDTDLKLERIIEYRPCLRFDITPCDQRAELEEVEWCPLCVTRAALPAREKGTTDDAA